MSLSRFQATHRAFALRQGLLALGCWAAAAEATEVAEAARQLDAITVTATRREASSYNIPASIDLIQSDAPGLGVNLSEWLGGVPGLMARERQNYAQDTQISLRGFGARAAFGIRGVRLILDGIPATQPDGQGQVAHFNLASAERVEVLRGPFSALYGNSSGGVIQMFSADGGEQTQTQVASFIGSDGAQRQSLVLSGPAGPLRYRLGYSHFETRGYRAHGSAQRDSLNGKFKLDLGTGGRLSLVLNHFDSPQAQDPLGLSRKQAAENPRQATAAASQFDTRKSTAQSQAGLSYRRQFGSAGELQLSGYGGEREILQFLAIPVAAQNDPRHSGGVVALASHYQGGDARWLYAGDFWQRPLNLVAGVSGDVLRQHRRGYENFVGSQLGVQGALRRDEINTVSSFDQYLQADWQLASAWSLAAGLRHSALRFRSADRYIRAQNPDDSGGVNYQALTPVAGLLWRASAAAHFYIAYGSGFETPTFAELAYRPDGAAGLNFALAPARSRNAELGAKLRLAASTRLNAAVFRADTRDELVTVSNSGGRATFANAGKTRRQGAELALSTALHPKFNASLAATLLQARVREPYRTCTSTPCSTAQTPVPRGSHLPGVADGQLSARLDWAPSPGFQAGLEYRSLDAVPVNDSNSEAAASYGLVDVSAAYRRAWARSDLRISLKLENLFDERSIGSVIVNDGNGRYYEPAPGRSFLLGLEWGFAP